MSDTDSIPAITVNDRCWVYGEREGFCVVQEERDANGEHVRTLSSMVPWSVVEKALKGRPKNRK